MDQITELGLDSALGATFEPLQRPRSNTWPLPRPDMDKDEMDMDKNECPDQGMVGGISPPQGNLPQKKNSSRRNAWGNMSYADLITRAINSAPDKRLTLSQIYDWMVQNVPYFKNKGDSNSSAGWKNSIRHNLSLHNRFMRVQNEGAGKSSWWMINQDAPAGKAARRRAASMETQKFEKKRGRVKKMLDARSNGGLTSDATPSPSSSVSENLDMFPDSPVLNNNQTAAGAAAAVAVGAPAPAPFQLSPDFRPRASSNASSCSRLSPISALEQDTQVPPLSPISWNSDLSLCGQVNMFTVSNTAPPAYPTDLDNLKLCDSITEAMTLNDPLPMKQNSTSYSSFYNTPVYTELSPVRSLNLDRVPSLNRVKMESRDLYCNGGLSAGVKPPPTIPESQEPVMSCSSPGLRSLAPLDSLNNLHRHQMLKQEPSVSQLRGHLLASDCADLNIDVLDTLHGGLECDVDQVIKHELSVDGSLEFNFTDSVPSDSNQVHLQPPQGSHSWVH